MNVTTLAPIRVLTLATAVFFCGSALAIGAPINAEVISCVADTCTIEPVDGPVNVDPLGFTMDVVWGPNYLLLNEDPGGHGFMRLFFNFTGVHEGTEHLGNIVLRDAAGLPIPGLDVEFDDLNPVAGVVTANYEIFGPSSFLHGFSLSLSEGSGVDTMEWTGATIFPAELVRVRVPEPSVLCLFAAGLGIVMRRRSSK